ncbi:hypothetical protein DAPPUDRAFT_249192 [Daphnia pulex]|uniref:Uncharacterized protein n=1 Tax=Daphnia pulex TaxID=6669 RepID=E9GW35_DAPPU|nr:hypothetical protein DAPPUDRAFT_249192 [Daphnia pulex]|eukprot:EFX76336.1 hypothetical protein DAPPUDRAFT_249192 [Daphnia pulex]
MSQPDRSGERRRRLAVSSLTPRCEDDCEDLRGAGGVLGGHWRRWRRALLGRSSSTPSSTADLGDFCAKFPQMEEVLQVYPKDTPLALFTSLLPEDLVNLPDQSGLRQRILNAVEMARQWINQSEQIHLVVEHPTDLCLIRWLVSRERCFIFHVIQLNPHSASSSRMFSFLTTLCVWDDPIDILGLMDRKQNQTKNTLENPLSTESLKPIQKLTVTLRASKSN